MKKRCFYFGAIFVLFERREKNNTHSGFRVNIFIYPIIAYIPGINCDFLVKDRFVSKYLRSIFDKLLNFYARIKLLYKKLLKVGRL